MFFLFDNGLAKKHRTITPTLFNKVQNVKINIFFQKEINRPMIFRFCYVPSVIQSVILIRLQINMKYSLNCYATENNLLISVV